MFSCLRRRTPIAPLTQCLRVHTVHCTVYLFKQGGEELYQREGERGNRVEYRSQNWVENTNVTEFRQEIVYFQSMNSDKHLPQSPFTVQFF